MSNNANALYEALFDVLRGVRNGNVSIEKAKAVSDTAQTIINLVKAEADMIKAVGPRRLAPSGFLSAAVQEDTLDRQQRTLEHAPQPKPGSGLPPTGPKASL